MIRICAGFGPENWTWKPIKAQVSHGFERKEKVRLSVREKECEEITRLLRASYTLAPSMALRERLLGQVLEVLCLLQKGEKGAKVLCLLQEGEKGAEVLCLLQEGEKQVKVCYRHREGDIASGTPPHQILRLTPQNAMRLTPRLTNEKRLNTQLRNFKPWCEVVFLDGDSVVYLNKELLNELLYSTADRITGRYYEMAADVVNLVS
ncbi:hypothetical protein IEQ34_000755 [Dendrobium chrysotoxum]|uniref:Uncharacterized protein n=1 Tax=Dendrobium chrysotoxum TaxID=161865 RepID=A0AAV7HTV6_DENCH|nr:hypothetical protein IEQ34_000755 [Dendrobium chrysotoxum]